MTVREISAKERLPADYVEQILLRLRRAGVVKSTRGAKGGYLLSRPASEITMQDVIHASELETFDLHCISHPVEEDRCSSSHSCSMSQTGRILQDAMPNRLGQEFTAYGGTLRRGISRVKESAEYLRYLGIGGSAVGTGVNVEPQYPPLTVKQLREMSGLELRGGTDRVQLMQSMGDAAGFSAQLRVLAIDLSKIASDLRLMASGPRTGLDEIRLPAVAWIVDHAREGEPLRTGDGQPDLLPGHGGTTAALRSPPSMASSS